MKRILEVNCQAGKFIIWERECKPNGRQPIINYHVDGIFYPTETMAEDAARQIAKKRRSLNQMVRGVLKSRTTQEIDVRFRLPNGMHDHEHY